MLVASVATGSIVGCMPVSGIDTVFVAGLLGPKPGSVCVAVIIPPGVIGAPGVQLQPPFASTTGEAGEQVAPPGSADKLIVAPGIPVPVTGPLGLLGLTVGGGTLVGPLNEATVLVLGPLVRPVPGLVCVAVTIWSAISDAVGMQL